MATPTSILSQKKSQIPATLIRTGVLQKLLLGLTHLHTDPFVIVLPSPAGAPSKELSREEQRGGGRSQSEGCRTGSAPSQQVLTSPGHLPPVGFWKVELSSLRGVGRPAKPAALQPSCLPPGQRAPGAWPTTVALELAGCPGGIGGHVSHCAEWEWGPGMGTEPQLDFRPNPLLSALVCHSHSVTALRSMATGGFVC